MALGRGDDGLGPQVEAAQELRVEGDDDRRGRHEDRTDAHRQDEPDRREDARGQGDGEEVVAGGPPEVLLHLPVAGPRELEDGEHRTGIVGGEDDSRRADRDIGARTDRDADIGLREGGGVVDAVADHRDRLPLGLEFGDLRRLVRRAHAGEDPVDAEVSGHGSGDRLGVAGDHDDLDVLGVEGLDGLPGLGPDLIGEAQRADDLPGDEDVEDDRSLGPPGLGDRGLDGPAGTEEVGSSDLDLGAVDLGAHSDGR